MKTKKFKVTRKTDSVDIIFDLKKSAEQLGQEEKIREYIEAEKNNSISKPKDFEKESFLCSDVKQIKFFFVGGNGMFSSTFQANNLSAEEKEFFYRSQFIVELYDTNSPNTQRRIDTYYITLFSLLNGSQSVFNTQNTLDFIFMRKDFIRDKMYLKFFFYNAKLNKKYLFRLGNGQINNDTIHVEINLNKETNRYNFTANTLDLYQAVVFSNNNLPEDNNGEGILSDDLLDDEMNKIIDTLSPEQDTLLNNGLLILPQAQDFFNLTNNFNDGDEDQPTRIWQDFYQPSYPVVIVQLLGWIRRNISTGQETVTPILKNNLTISRANNFVGDNSELYGLAIRINYPNSFSTPCATFREPIADLVYSLEFTPLFCDYEIKNNLGSVTINNLLPPPATFTIPLSSSRVEDVFLGRGTTQNLRVGIGLNNTPRPERLLTGFWEIQFVTDRDDINVLYTDANGLYLDEDDTRIVNPNLQEGNPPFNTLFVPEGELGQDFYCNITTAGVKQPADVIRLRKF